MMFLLAWLLTADPVVADPVVESGPQAVVVVGKGGEPAYVSAFAGAATQWKTRLGNRCRVVAPGEAESTQKARTFAAIDDITEPLWIVLIGHGTDDGQTPRISLDGPDLSAQELAEAIASRDTPTAVLVTSSASGAFVNVLSGPGRVVVTATKNAQERDATRMPAVLAETIATGRGDFDKDGRVSLLEIAVDAAARVEGSYDTDGQIATEHALIDDNGDGRGTRLDWFDGVRIDPAKARDGAVDGELARTFFLDSATTEAVLSEEDEQRRRDLERQLEQLRRTRPQRVDDAYLDQLEAILVPLARLSVGKAGEASVGE